MLVIFVLSSVWPIDRILLGATTLGQSRQGSNGNEGVLYIPQSSKTGALLSDGLISYPKHLLGGALLLVMRCSRCILQPQPIGVDLT